MDSHVRARRSGCSKPEHRDLAVILLDAAREEARRWRGEEDIANEALMAALEHQREHPRAPSDDLVAFVQLHVRNLARAARKKQRREPSASASGTVIDTHAVGVQWGRRKPRPRARYAALSAATRRALAQSLERFERDLCLDFRSGLIFGEHAQHVFADLFATIARHAQADAADAADTAEPVSPIALGRCSEDVAWLEQWRYRASVATPEEWRNVRDESIEARRRRREPAMDTLAPGASGEHDDRDLVAQAALQQDVNALIAFRDKHLVVRCKRCAPLSQWTICKYTIPRFDRLKQIGGVDLGGRGRRSPRLNRRSKFGRNTDVIPYSNSTALYLAQDAAGRLVSEALRLTRVSPTVRHVLANVRARDEQREIDRFSKGWERGPRGNLQGKPDKRRP